MSKGANPISMGLQLMNLKCGNVVMVHKKNELKKLIFLSFHIAFDFVFLFWLQKPRY